MTSEQRLDRLERIARLMVRAGLRARRQMREQDEKINILIDSQLKNEERFAALGSAQAGASAAAAETDNKVGILIDSQIRNEETVAALAKAQAGAAAAAAATDDKVRILLDAQIKNDERFAELAKTQAQTSAGLDNLRDTVDRYIRERRNGHA